MKGQLHEVVNWPFVGHLFSIWILRADTAAGLTWNTGDIVGKLAAVGFVLGLFHGLTNNFDFKNLVTLVTAAFASPALVETSVGGVKRLKGGPSFAEKLLAIDSGTLVAALIIGVGVFFGVRYVVELIKEKLF
jgi:hypothetical protein